MGANGEGKTSILEAACVLLRLQSQRSSSLAPLVRLSEKTFGVSGHCNEHLLEFRYSPLRRKVAFDDVEQRKTNDYLRIGHVVSFATSDIELTRGGSEARRRYLDFLGAQINPRYRPTLRAYERALRARNALLKSPHPRSREIAAYDPPLIANGTQLLAMRARWSSGWRRLPDRPIARSAEKTSRSTFNSRRAAPAILREELGRSRDGGDSFAADSCRSASG